MKLKGLFSAAVITTSLLVAGAANAASNTINVGVIAGAEAQVAEVADSDVGVVAYVSCNPISFARDAAMLTEAGYSLEHLRVVDQFKWSSHVEIVSKFLLKSQR